MTLESLEIASNDFNASVNTSALVLPAVELPADGLPLLAARAGLAPGARTVDHTLGLDQAFRIGAALTSSGTTSSEAAGDGSASTSTSATIMAGLGFDSSAFADDGRGEASLGRDFGMAGIIGLADLVLATGVVSPCAGNEGLCCEDGVVGWVESYKQVSQCYTT